MRCRLSPVTPVSVDRTTLFYGTYVPERDPMDLMQIVVDIALVGLVSLTVIGVIAVTVLAAKAAKDGSHGCGPVEKEETEEDRAEKQRQDRVAYHLSLWEMGQCKHCRNERECYTPDQLCSECLYSEEFGPSY